MLTKTEKQFYKVFDIEPITLKKFKYDTLAYMFNTVEIDGERYPKITDTLLLKLMCAYNDFQNCTDFLCTPFCYENTKIITLEKMIDSLNAEDLNKYYCNNVDKLKRRVRKIFKEG